MSVPTLRVDILSAVEELEARLISLKEKKDMKHSASNEKAE